MEPVASVPFVLKERKERNNEGVAGPPVLLNQKSSSCLNLIKINKKQKQKQKIKSKQYGPTHTIPSSQTSFSPLLNAPQGQEVPRVGARLQSFWKVWEDKGASPWVVSVLRDGYNLEFEEEPPLTRVPSVVSQYQDPLKQELLGEEISALLKKGALEEVKDHCSPGFYSRMFLVTKKTGDWRPIIDLSVLNTYLRTQTFKMESAESIRASLLPGWWTFSIDLKDAYLHVPIHPAARKYMRVCFQGKVYQFKALPFGLSPAPWLFTKVVSEVKAMVHGQGIQLHQFLDDWLGKATTPEECSRHAMLVLQLVQSLGWVVNFEKSDLIPRQVFDFLGIHFNLVDYTVFPTGENLTKLKTRLSMLRVGQWLTANQWQQLIGMIASQERLVKYGMLHTKPFHWHLGNHWNAHRDPPDTMVEVSEEIMEEVGWWLQVTVGLVEPVVRPEPGIRIFTDACTTGWGAHVGDTVIKGIWSPEETLLHINVLEMRAVRLALSSMSLKHRTHILVSTDNTSVVAYINRQGGTRSWSLWEETILLFEMLQKRGVTLRAVHIPGRLNVIADMLSREGQVLPTEWSLNQRVVLALFREWGTPQVDLFATRYNHKCLVFVSPVPDDLAYGTDALSLDWNRLWGYAFPPQPILNKVLQKVRTSECRVILIASAWVQQPYYPDLLELSVRPPFRLPPLQDLLSQPLTGVLHQQPEVLQLHAWLLSTGPWQKGDFPKRQPVGSQLPRPSLPLGSMRASGRSSLLGVRNGVSIHSRLLPLL